MNSGAWRSRDFRLLLAGRGLSSIGDNVVNVALAFAVLDLTGSVKDLGIVLAARAVPLAILLLLGGVWADRLPRRLLMLCADAVRAVAQVASGLLVLGGGDSILAIAALQFVYGCGSALFMPASVGIVPETVAEEQLQEANSLLSVSENLAGIAGPALAGVVVVAVGAGWGLLVDGASFAVSVALLAAMQVRGTRAAPTGESTLEQLRHGWRAFAARRWLIVSVPAFMVVNALSFAPLFVLGPAVARQSYGGAGAWALLLAAFGVGALLGGLSGTRLALTHPLRFTMLFSLSGAPVLLVALALRAPLGVLAVCAVFAGADVALFNLIWYTLLQRQIPGAELARVSSWDSLGSFVATPIGYALTGPVAAAAGTDATLIAAAAIFVVTTLFALCFRSVRTLGYATSV